MVRCCASATSCACRSVRARSSPTSLAAERDVLDGTMKLRAIAARTGAPRAFDEAGLELARWVAHTYLCSLREALTAVVLADAVPRVVERFVPAGERPARRTFSERARTADAFALGRRPGRHLAGGAAAASRSAPQRRPPHADRRHRRARARRRACSGSERSCGRRSASGRFACSNPGDGRFAAAVRRRWRHTCASTRRCGVPMPCWPGFSDAVIRRAIAAGAVRESQRSLESARTGTAQFARSRADGRAARGDRCDRGRDRRRRIRTTAGVRRDRQRQDARLSARDRARSRSRRTSDRARAGDRADAADGGAFRARLRRTRRRLAFGAFRTRTLRCVASRRARRTRRDRRCAQRRVRSAAGRADDRRR